MVTVNDKSELNAEVEKGGVPWSCEDCKRIGVIKAGSPWATEFRKTIPAPIGVKFTHKHCPACNPNLEEVK